MSTRGEIALFNKDGSIISCYNHYDSYIMGGIGEDLFKEWNDPKLARMAVMTHFGNCSEEDNEGLGEFKSLEDFENMLANSDREWAYLWKDNRWLVLEVDWDNVNREWKLLSELVT